jgi:hypothetical protein
LSVTDLAQLVALAIYVAEHVQRMRKPPSE